MTNDQRSFLLLFLIGIPLAVLVAVPMILASQADNRPLYFIIAGVGAVAFCGLYRLVIWWDDKGRRWQGPVDGYELKETRRQP